MRHTHLESAGYPESEEERNKQRSGHEPGQHVTDCTNGELATSRVDLGRMAKHQHPADDRHEHGNGDRQRPHLPVGWHVLADRSLAAAGQGVVDADADGNGKKQAEQEVVRYVETLHYPRRHRLSSCHQFYKQIHHGLLSATDRQIPVYWWAHARIHGKAFRFATKGAHTWYSAPS